MDGNATVLPSSGRGCWNRIRRCDHQQLLETGKARRRAKAQQLPRTHRQAITVPPRREQDTGHKRAGWWWVFLDPPVPRQTATSQLPCTERTEGGAKGEPSEPGFTCDGDPAVHTAPSRPAPATTKARRHGYGGRKLNPGAAESQGAGPPISEDTMNPTTHNTAQPSPAETAMHRIESAISRLESRSTEIREKLNPVLAAAPPSVGSADCADRPTSSVPLVEAVDTCTDRINYVAEVLGDLIERLAV